MVCIKSIGNNFFLTWLYVATRSHRAGSVVRSLTFKTRQASVACERLFRLDRVFSGSLPSDSVQAQNAASDWVNRETLGMIRQAFFLENLAYYLACYPVQHKTWRTAVHRSLHFELALSHSIGVHGPARCERAVM